ncbi:MAG: DUF2846 domain-containing protein, partial [Alphaproteobacteria bacterium]|nr:DUF2846 domain-containing protein [Alphaproteobacteria bacterium]
ACTASGPAFTPVQLENPKNALIYIYRSSTLFYSANPEIPILYVDDKRLLPLKIGGDTWASVEPGTHKILVRHSILGVPAFSLGEVSISAEPGAIYYLKFSQQAGDIVSYGTQVIVTANSKLRPVDETTGLSEIMKTKYLPSDQ